MKTTEKSAAGLRAQLGHPVIDNDGHILEMTPVLTEFIREVGGPGAVDRYLSVTAATRAATYGKRPALSAAEREDAWVGRTSWWGITTNAYDRATSMLPRLFCERLGELGIDFAILYPTEGLYANRIDVDDELRRTVCRAVNLYQMELFKDCRRQVMPVAVIPMFTPEEAVEELDFAVGTLGYRTVVFNSAVPRPIPKYAREYPEAAHLLRRIDFLGLDSAYDYDLVWRKCAELRVPVTFHGQTIGTWSGPISVSSTTFNRLANVGSGYPALLLALLLGGVVDRFPSLKFVFQEAGAGWLSTVYAQFLGVWEKRNGSIIEHHNPANVDTGLLATLINQYGGERERRHLDWVDTLTRDLVRPEIVDEFAAVGASTKAELRDLFESRFYAGCEADDWTAAHAFAGNPKGAVLNATFGSDIGHWDVLDADDVLPEAFELLEEGVLDESQLKGFLFQNAFDLYRSVNPNFFDGTVLEDLMIEAPSGAIG